MSESILDQLALIEPDWEDVMRRSGSLRRQHVRRQALLTVGGFLAAAALASGAYAVVRAIWTGHDMTPADINRQATTIFNDKWSVCDGHGHCTDETGTHKQVNILPSMGVVFVLPDGDTTALIPGVSLWNIPAAPGPGAPTSPAGSQGFRDDSGNSWGTAYPLRDQSGRPLGGVWKVPLSGGGERTITWKQATGSVTVRDSLAGATKTTQLGAGDVVPLVPGTLATDSRTLDKAVTFDLPTGNRVIIFPELNETYINAVSGPAASDALPYGAARQYGLSPSGNYEGKLPVTSEGGTWTAHLRSDLTRTISWNAGDSFVTVMDRTASGTTSMEVPIGHELPLVPFK